MNSGRRGPHVNGVSVGRTLAHGEAIKMSSLSGPAEKRFKLAKAQFAEPPASLRTPVHNNNVRLAVGGGLK
jgi:hypothetical protein